MLAVGFICFTTQICAFWEAGHLIIAKIAYDELKQKDPDFLGQIEAEIMDIRRFISTSDAGHPFIESSVWADKINGVTNGKFSNKHYINIPYINSGFDCQMSPLSSNIVEAIKMTKDRLLNKVDTLFDYGNKYKFTKTVSFAWRVLIHLVGDIHQPLHSTALCSKAFPHGDKGGNLFKIKFNGNKKIKNLHSLWDSCLGQQTQIRVPLNAEDWQLLTESVENITSTYPRSAVQQRVAILDEQEWANESYDLAVKFVYNGTVAYKEQLPEYISRGRMVINEQLAVAGYRLADLILSLKLDYKIEDL